MRPPIFFAWTRSFWLGIVPSLLIVLDVIVQVAAAMVANPGLTPPVASLIGWMLGADPVVIEGWMLRFAPLFALLIAQQRSGSSRPYTIDPKARQ
jgi:hypothetical protein